MKILIAFFAFLSILLQTHSVSSLNPTCGFYDFNDPFILSEFNDCTLTGSRPLRIESYSDSGFSFLPFREESQHFLTTNKSVHSDITQCISTKVQFRGNFSSFSIQIGINLRNNNDIDQHNDVQLFISNILAFQITPSTNGWMLYERDYSLPNLGAFDDAVIGLKVRIGSNSDLAVEFLKFFDRQTTDEMCVPSNESTTSHQPEITTEITQETEAPTQETEAPTQETEAPTQETEAPTQETEAPTQETEAPTQETEAPTQETEAPTQETEAPTQETEAPTQETEAPTQETEAPTQETEAPTQETEAPTQETEAPTQETEAPTQETEAPTQETEAPTQETEAPTQETEAPTPDTDTPPPETEFPACLEVDFNNTTSLVGTFKACHAQYLPEFIIKSYLDTTITPYREASLFYLSNKWEGLSCLETTSTFPLTESSIVESVIFLDGVSPGAWIEISVADLYTSKREVVKRLETANSWIRFSERIQGSYSNAKFMIKTNMNAYSKLAVEYLKIRSDSC